MAFYRDIKYRASDTADIQTLDNITFDGSSSYSLTRDSAAFTPSGASNILLSIDGVVQSGNFTITGSTIDFGVNVPATSECDFILHLGVGVINTPADGSVTEAKIANGAVSLDKLSATGTKDSTTFLRGDNTFATVSGGTNTPMFKVTRNGSNQTISSSTSTKLAHNYKVFDTDNAFNTTTNRFTVPSGKAGKYIFYAIARFDSSVSATRLLTMIYKNGANVAEVNMYNNDEVSAGLSTVLNLSDGDYVEHYVYQNTGSSKPFKGSNLTTYFYGYRLTE